MYNIYIEKIQWIEATLKKRLYCLQCYILPETTFSIQTTKSYIFFLKTLFLTKHIFKLQLSKILHAQRK